MLQQVIHYLLFGLLVQSSDVEGNEFELIPLSSHFGEISVDFVPSTSLVFIAVFAFLR